MNTMNPGSRSIAITIGLSAVLGACRADSEAASCCSGDAMPAATTTALPGDSVWQIGSEWQDQDGRAFDLADLRGEVVVTAMIFTHCLYACPRIVADLQEIEARLAARGDGLQPRYLLVSMDHDRDDPATLRAFAADHGLDPARWTLLHGDELAVREFAAVLGVSFRRAPSGDYDHSNQIAVLDRDGRIVHRQQGLQADSTTTLQALADLLSH